MPAGRFVSYLRVSTDRQGRSGLGLEAQRAAVAAHLAGGGLVAEVVEIESGRRNGRPELARALSLCKTYGAILVVAKLDRLARNVAFVSALIESGVEFIAVDFPHASKLTIHILAAVAEHEAQMISDRTKAALAAAKARGVRLGGFRGHTGTAEDCAIATTALRRKADDSALRLADFLAEHDPGNRLSLRALAAVLEAHQIRTSSGQDRWSATAVRRLRARLAALEEGAKPPARLAA